MAGEGVAQGCWRRQSAGGGRSCDDSPGERWGAGEVTTFIECDVGRTLQTSGTGCDRGWGSHQLVLGGAVKGGDLYGTFPTMALGGPDDSSTRGAMIPTTSVDQYGGTMAKWFGVSAAAMPQVFPNIANFAVPDLGFLG